MKYTIQDVLNFGFRPVYLLMAIKREECISTLEVQGIHFLLHSNA